MASTSRLEGAMMKKYEKLKNEGEPIDCLRAQCLARGAAGIKSLGRTFRVMDDDGNRKLDMNEFKKGLHDFGVMLTPDKIQSLFNQIDLDHNGTIDFDEFLIALRPKMNANRLNLVMMAFRKMDRIADGVITVEDLKGVYNVKKHPKYISGQWDEDKCLKEFLDSFEVRGNHDGQVTEEEWINYYSGLSASIDNDAYFDLMMRNAWKLS